MALILNSKIMGLVIDELEKAVTRTGKSIHDITNTLSSMHPEILFSPEDWDRLLQKTKDGIINKIRKTLESFA
ncbi:MAG: hypothetical protein H6Q73_1133 [Firmicutes bacterium]|nr:hypothetical protein [Bacillota bacterium]